MLKNSNECTKSELDLFYIPPTNTSIEEGRWVTCQPKTKVDSGSIEFLVSKDQYYIDLSNVYLKVQARVLIYTDDSTSVISENSIVAPVNNFMHSLFSQVDIKLNNISIENSNSVYPYKAYINELLNHGQEIKNTMLQSSLFFKDTAGKMDSIVIPAAASASSSSSAQGVQNNENKNEVKLDINEGFLNRRKLITSNGGSVDMCGRLHCDLFNSNRYLLNNVELQVNLTRNKNEFCLMGDNKNYGVKINNISLMVRKVSISPSVSLAHNLVLEKSLASYPLKEIIIRPITIESGVSTFTKDISSGTLPTRVVLGMVTNSAFSGAKNKNPFNFQHFNISSLDLRVNDISYPYSNALKFDFDKKEYMSGYWTLFDNIDNNKNGNYITRDDYANGYTLFAFDLSPDLCSGEHFSLQKTGTVSVELNFSKNTPEVLTLLAYFEMDKILYINNDRNVEYVKHVFSSK